MLLIGHRGAKAHAPENTLLGFKTGIKMGANAIEFDVRVSKDGVPVCMHDDTLERTTNGKGKVNGKPLKELKTLDAGKKEKIPTVKEALRLLKKNNITPVVEIKDKKDAKKTASVVKQAGMASKAIIISYHTDALKQVKHALPKTQTGLIFKNKIKDEQGFMRLGKAVNVDWYFGRGDALSKKLIALMHKWHYKSQVWLCNTKTEIKKFAGYGVDGIASDKPDLFECLK